MNSTDAAAAPPRRRDLRAWRGRRSRRLRTLRRAVGVAGVLVLGATVAVAVPALRDESGSVTLAGFPDRVTARVERDLAGVSRGGGRDAPLVSSANESGGSASETTPVAEPEPTAAGPDAGAAQPADPAPPAPEPAAPAAVDPAIEFAATLVAQANEQRAAAGLAAFAGSECATSQAAERAALLVAEGRFEHDPLGPILSACGGRTVGENLALGYRSPAEMTAGWMASPGHRENIMRASYTSIGIGCVDGPSGMLCAQVFLG